MRESFVFHFEYLEDIPEDLQPKYAMYIINYARYGEQPAFNDWRDQRMWNRTKERMDAETERYEKKCRNLRHQPLPEDTEEPPVIFVNFDRQPEALPHYDNGEKKQPKKRFIKPTVQEVIDYCQERKNNIDGQQFVDFYEAKGWKVGREPMKDWKAAVRTWEKRHQAQPSYGPAKQLPEDRLTL